jgi:hypothetical protein
MRATRHCSDPRGRVLTRQRADSVPAVSGRRLHLSTRKNSVGNPVLIHVRRSRVTCTSLRRSRIRHATHARGRRCRCSPRLTRPQSSCDLAAIARVHIGRDPRGIGVRTADGVITNRDHADVDDRRLCAAARDAISRDGPMFCADHMPPSPAGDRPVRGSATHRRGGRTSDTREEGASTARRRRDADR